MSDNTETRQDYVLHVRSGSTRVVAAMDARLESVPLRLERCGDVYRGLARLLTDGGDKTSAVVVCANGLGSRELEFFPIVSRRRPGLAVYLYGDSSSQPAIARALELGATGIINEEVIQSLAIMPASPREHPDKEATSPEDRPECVGHAAPGADETDLPREVDPTEMEEPIGDVVIGDHVIVAREDAGAGRVIRFDESVPDVDEMPADSTPAVHEATADDDSIPAETGDADDLPGPGVSDETTEIRLDGRVLDAGSVGNANIAAPNGGQDNARLSQEAKPGSKDEAPGLKVVSKSDDAAESGDLIDRASDEDEAEAHGSVRVPWLRYGDGPSRRPPDSVEPESLSPGPPDYDPLGAMSNAPLLTEEELDALLGDGTKPASGVRPDAKEDKQ